MLEPNSRLGAYEILDPLGAGGMGEVYRARDSRLGREVAIKVLRARDSFIPGVRQRFEREAQLISKLNHPNICTLHDIGRDGDVDYLVMELLDGETLADRIERAPVTVTELCDIAEGVADALGCAHSAGVVHRDLKPGNVMLTGSGVKLLDFGLAQPQEHCDAETTDSQTPTASIPLTAEGTIIGTFQYMAPEQLEGREVDARSDVFAFGCMLYEMATRTRPFSGKTATSILGSILRAGPQTFVRLSGAVPSRVVQIIRRCLRHDPAERFATANEVGKEFARLRDWVRNDALPELARIVERTNPMEEGPDCWTAFKLARDLEPLAGDDQLLGRMWRVFSNEINVVSDPPGAAFSAKYYGEPNAEWIHFGKTPIENVRFPLGIARLKLEMPNRRDVHDVIWHLPKSYSSASLEDGTKCYRLLVHGEIPDEMELVPGGGSPVFMPGLDHLKTEPTPEFLMDRDPVTNREFKRFVDDGGYETPEYWTQALHIAEGELSRDEVMTRFTDVVGRPGPASWEFGEYPHGDDDLPVAGVSWLEAVAYAAWCDKELPTLFHWNRVAATAFGSQIIPQANLEGRRPLPVGSTTAEHKHGVRDLAGNVREWVWNEGRRGERFILGGGWNDPGYSFMDAYAQSAFDRSLTNGFRCIRSIEPDVNRENLSRRIELPFRDFLSETPVPDDVFSIFLRQFEYDDAPLESAIEEAQRDENAQRYLVSFNAAYAGERMLAYVFLPTTAPPPFQAVLVFPGSLAIHQRTVSFEELRRSDFIVKSGRALILPVYKGTYQRGSSLKSDYPEETTAYKDHVVMWAKDLARSIDYLESRDDIDAERVAYLGTSWGGALGSIMPAVEKRLRTNVLYVAGLNFQRALPEVDQINYVTRVTQPTLMLNGELDFYFPEESSQRPMFELLGSKPGEKKRITYPSGHSVPRTEFVKETLRWLDRYLGPTK